jgi:hypothetical protein
MCPRDLKLAYTTACFIVVAFGVIACGGLKARGPRNSASDPYSQQMTTQHVPYTTAQELVTLGKIKTLDSQNNPFSGQYHSCDQWIWANCKLLSDGLTNQVYQDDATSGSSVYEVHTLVNSEGYVLPFALSAEKLEARRHGKENLDGFSYLYSKGPMSNQTVAEIQDLDLRSRAQFYPPVPGWLVSKCPDGGAILLRGHTPDPWVCLYNPDLETYFAKYSLEERGDGYFVFLDKKTQELVAAFDYDGTRLSNRPTSELRKEFDLLSADSILAFALSNPNIGTKND